MSAAPKRAVVVGGGISGLAAARALVQDGRVSVTLLERAARLGGNIVTEHTGGYTIDGGPDSWITTKPRASQLAREVGLGEELMPTIEANRRVYVAHEGKLHALPEGLVLGIPTEVMPIAKSGLFSWDAKLRMALEPFIPPRAWVNGEDESIGDFIARRLGDEVSDRLAGPMLGGIFAGDAREISIRAAFPMLVEAEKKYGSIVQAMRAMRAMRKGHGGGGESAFVSLKGGMQDLIDAVAKSAAGVQVVTGVEVRAIERGEGKYRVVVAGGEPIDADAVVLAAPMHALTHVTRTLDPELADALGAFFYASTATVFLAFPREAIARDLDASGFLVPRGARRAILASTWVTSKWDHRAPEGHVLVRAFFGGAGRESILAETDDDLARIALDDLGSLMPITGKPSLTRVFRFDRGSPQPTLGHLGRVTAVKDRLARWPGLHVAVNGFDGIGIPDCVKSAEAAASAVLASFTP